MGWCCCFSSSSADASDPSKNDERYARQLQAQENRSNAQRASAGSAPQPTVVGRQAQPSWNTAGTGHTLGGTSGAQEEGASLTAEERRQRALEAAQRRQDTVPGISKQKAAEMREKASKEEYLGKLSEHYRKKGADMPMGLNAASAQQLKNNWEQIRSADPAGAVLNQ